MNANMMAFSTILCVSLLTGYLLVQMYLLARDLLKYHSSDPSLICGYASRSKEGQILKSVNLLITTPLDLLDHLQNTKGFSYENLKVSLSHSSGIYYIVLSFFHMVFGEE